MSNSNGLDQALLRDENGAATPGQVDDGDDGSGSQLRRGFTAFNPGPPKDANNLVYVCMLVIGVGVLLPWNAVITAVDYYSATYSFVADNIETYISAAFTTPCILVLFLMLRFGNSISITKRVVGTFIACTIGLVLLPVVATLIPCDSCKYNGVFNQSEAHDPQDVATSCYISLGVTIFLCFFTGMCANILQFSAFGFGGILPPMYTQALMAGNGVAGVVILILSIGTSVVYQCDKLNTTGMSNYTQCKSELADKRSSAYIYFALGGTILVICTILYLWIVRQPFTRYHMDNADMQSPRSDNATDSAPTTADGGATMQHVVGGDGDGDDDAAAAAVAEAVGHTAARRLQGEAVVDAEEGGTASGGGAAGDGDGDDDSVSSTGLCKLACTISPLAAQVYICFTITILLFPAVTVLIHYDNNMGWFNAIFGGCQTSMDAWWISLLLLCFNLFDLAGRMTAKYRSCTRCFNAHTLWIVTLARLGFIPLFLFATGVHADTHDALFNSYVVLLVMALFAFSNGYNGSLCMMFAPGKVQPQLAEKVGFIMSFCLQAGILSGSYGAIPVTRVLHISI